MQAQRQMDVRPEKEVKFKRGGVPKGGTMKTAQSQEAKLSRDRPGSVRVTAASQRLKKAKKGAATLDIQLYHSGADSSSAMPSSIPSHHGPKSSSVQKRDFRK